MRQWASTAASRQDHTHVNSDNANDQLYVSASPSSSTSPHVITVVAAQEEPSTEARALLADLGLDAGFDAGSRSLPLSSRRTSRSSEAPILTPKSEQSEGPGASSPQLPTCRDWSSASFGAQAQQLHLQLRRAGEALPLPREAKRARSSSSSSSTSSSTSSTRLGDLSSGAQTTRCYTAVRTVSLASHPSTLPPNQPLHFECAFFFDGVGVDDSNSVRMALVGALPSSEELLREMGALDSFGLACFVPPLVTSSESSQRRCGAEGWESPLSWPLSSALELLRGNLLSQAMVAKDVNSATTLSSSTTTSTNVLPTEVAAIQAQMLDLPDLIDVNALLNMDADLLEDLAWNAES